MKKLAPLFPSLIISSYFLLVLVPLLPLTSYDYFNNQRIFQLLMLFVVTVFVVISSLTKEEHVYSFEKQDKIYITTFLFFGFLSAVMSVEPLFSFMYTCHVLFLFLLMFFVSRANSKNAILIFIAGLIVAHTVLVLVSTLNIVFTLYEGEPLSPFVIYSGFLNIRFFNQVQIFILPLLVVLLKFGRIKNIIVLILVLNCLLMFIGYSRGEILTWIAILSFIFITNKGLRKYVLYALIISVFSYVIFLYLNSLGQGIVGGELLRGGSAGRLDMWVETLAKLNVGHLFIGGGPGLYEFSFSGSTPFSHPHNSILEVFNEWGMLALIVLTLLVISTMKRTHAHLNRHVNDILTSGLYYMWLAGLGYSMFSGVIVMPVPQTLLFITWGMVIGRVSYAKGQPFCDIVTLNQKTIMVVGCCMLLCLLSLYIYLSYQLYISIDPDLGNVAGPRFWSIGKRFE